MNTIIEEIDSALIRLNISKQEFNFVGTKESEILHKKLFNHFVIGNDRRWWWESFKFPSQSFTANGNNSFELINKIVPDINEKIWFIAEENCLPYYPIYETTPDLIVKVIGECYFFEYYLIPKDESWLLCENHHNRFIAIGSTIINKVKNNNSINLLS